MTRTTARDFKLTANGDILLVQDEESLSEVSDYAALMQTMKVRVMSSDPDVIDPTEKDFCCNLEDLIGLPNTVETAQLGIEKITRSLTHDGLVSQDDLYIRPTPVNRTMMVFFVFVKKESGDNMYFEVIINFELGVTIGRESL